MTVVSTINREDFIAQPNDDSFDFPFKYFKATDIELYIDAALQTAGYTVSPHSTGPAFGGTVTLTNPLSGGEAVVVKRKLPNTQETDYVENDDFPSQVAEDDYDRAAMRDQDQNEVIARCLKTGPASTIVDTIIADPDATSVGKALTIAAGEDPNTYKVVYSQENITDIIAAVKADADRAEVAANDAEADADRAENAANNITGQTYEGTLADGQTVISPTWTWQQGNLRVFLDGVLQQQSQYTEDTTAGTVTLNSAVGAGVVFTLLSNSTDAHGAFLQQALNLSDVNDKAAALNNLDPDILKADTADFLQAVYGDEAQGHAGTDLSGLTIDRNHIEWTLSASSQFSDVTLPYDGTYVFHVYPSGYAIVLAASYKTDGTLPDPDTAAGEVRIVVEQYNSRKSIVSLQNIGA